MRFSGGRTILGVGAGWLREEFTALGVDTFERRGKALDEAIRIYRGVFTERGDLSFEGEVYRFGPIRVGRTRPARWRADLDRRPQPSRPAPRRRAGRWLAGHPRDPGRAGRWPRQYRGDVAPLRAQAGRCSAGGRHVGLGARAPAAGDVHESDLVGSAAEMAERVRAYRAEGVEHLLLQLQPSDSYAASLEAVEFFGREVRPLLGD